MITDTETLLVAALIIAIGSLIQATVGFGANLVAAPALILLEPDLVPGPLFVAVTVLTVLTAAREFGAVRWEFVRWSTAGRLPGVVVGALILVAVDQDTLALIVAGVILIGVILSTGVFRVSPSPAACLIAGVGSGFGGVTSSIGGPPLALLLQRESGPEVRATIGVSFLISTLLTVPAFILAGKLGSEEATTGIILMPASALGFLGSGPARSLVDGRRIRLMILMLCTLSALAVILRVVL